MINFPLRLVELQEVDSTNSYAKELIKKGEILEGTLITARRQTFGRGRLSRTWHSKEGESLTMSVVLETPPIPAVTLLCGIAVNRALSHFTESNCFSLKWPNDVLSENKKVAGILVERYLDFTIIGIGVNVNNRDFPEEIENKATSLRLIFGKDFDTRQLSVLIGKSLEQVFTEYNYSFCEKAKTDYTALCINPGKEVRFGEDFEKAGIVTGISEDGSLIVRSEKGEHLISTGEVFISGIY